MNSTPNVLYRIPRIRDGAKIHNLIRSSPPLDLNSIYAYYILCRDFSSYSIIAESGGSLVGYTSAYIRPEKPDTLFVWQVAVSAEARGLGIGKGMLKTIVRKLPPEVAFMETTISPSNTASQNLFLSFSTSGGFPVAREPFLSDGDFSGSGHEAEELYRITIKENHHGNI